jgi:hypothetical protein
MLYRSGQEKRQARRGVVAVIVVVSLVVLLSVVALAGDGGQALAERRNAQAAADAAAMSAASDLFSNWQANSGYDSGGSAVKAAQTAAAQQGYSTSNIAVNVQTSSSSSVKYQGGPNQGQALPQGYVEAIITYSQPANFSTVFGSGPVTVTARAVAAASWVFAPPVVVLNQTANKSLFLGSGDGTIYVPNNPVYVNSSHPNAMYDFQGTSNVTMQAPQYNVVGGASSGFNYYSNPTFPANGYLRTGTRPIPDPLGLIPAVDPTTLPTQNLASLYNSATDTYNLQPGRYIGGIDIESGPPLFLPATSNVTMAHGVYYMDGGGFTYNGSGNITAPDGISQASVMIYNGAYGASATPGTVNINTSGAVNLQPLPASYGLKQGITIFQDRTMASQPDLTIFHTTGSVSPWNITGCIYAPKALVTVARNNGDISVGSQFISDRLNLLGTGNMTITGIYVLTRGLTRVE